MAYVSEIAVIVKDEDRTYTQKFLEYDEFTISPLDKTLNACIKKTIEEFQGESEDVKVRITIQV